MQTAGGVLGGLFGLVLLIGFIALIVLWIALPFLIMGTNKRLDEMAKSVAASSHSQLKLLEAMNINLRRIATLTEKSVLGKSVDHLDDMSDEDLVTAATAFGIQISEFPGREELIEELRKRNA